MAGKKTPMTMMSASRLPALLGLSKYQTPNDELQATINAITGEVAENKQNESMAWGDRLEHLILMETGKRLELSDLMTEFEDAFYHPTLPLACSLDGYADGRGQVIRTDEDAGIFVIGAEQITLQGYGVLEAKLTAVQPEEIPALYRGPVQLQAQMDIMQAKWGALSVLYQGTQMRVFLFEPHAQTLETIKTAVLEFQNKLEKFRATGEIDFYPPANSKDADRMFPAADENLAINLPARAEQLADQITAAKAAIEEAEGKRAEAETELKAMLGDASKGTAGKYEIRWPMRSYKATAEKIVPAKAAYTIRQSTLSIKEARQ
jgi:predicted phage-related endonuclease